MTLLMKYIEKIKIKWIAKTIAAIVAIMIFICMIGFFALPFIKYSESSKIGFLCLWIFCTIIFSTFAFAFYKHDFKDNKKEIEEYEKDKVVYLVGRIGIGIYLIGVFLLILLVRNNFLSFSTTATVGLCVMGLLLFGIVITLLTQYKDNYKKMAKDTIKFLFVVFFVISCSIILLFGMMIYDNTIIPKIYSQIFIGFGAALLLLGGIYLVSRMFLSSNMFSEDSDSLSISIVLFIAIGVIACIILRYTISDEKMQEIMTAIFSAILGGAITLGGVAWTIKKGDMDRQEDIRRIEDERKEEERKKHIPYIKLDLPTKSYSSVIHIGAEKVFDFRNNEDVKRLKDDTYYILFFRQFFIKNVSSSNLILKGLLLEDDYYPFLHDTLLEHNGICCILPDDKTWIVFHKKIDSMNLILTDIMENQYIVHCQICEEINCPPKKDGFERGGIEYTAYSYTYEVTGLGLPRFLKNGESAVSKSCDTTESIEQNYEIKN